MHLTPDDSKRTLGQSTTTTAISASTDTGTPSGDAGLTSDATTASASANP